MKKVLTEKEALKKIMEELTKKLEAKPVVQGTELIKAKGITEEDIIRSEYFIKECKDKVTDDFRLWFVGFIEGFDSRAFVKKEYDQVWFRLALPRREKDVLYYIKENLKGLGVQGEIKETKRIAVFFVVDAESLLKLLCLFSGTMFFREYFGPYRFWVALYNSIYKKDIIIYKKTIEKLPMYTGRWVYNSTWLAGFLDARLMFLSPKREEKTGTIEGSLVIPMKVSREIKLFELLAKRYGGKIRVTEKNERRFFFFLDWTKSRPLYWYFVKFPLKTMKREVIRLFQEIVFMEEKVVLLKRLYTKEGRVELIRKVDQKIIGFNSVLKDFPDAKFVGVKREIWLTMSVKRAQKREAARLAATKNFFYQKYSHLLTQKPISYSIKLSGMEDFLFCFFLDEIRNL